MVDEKYGDYTKQTQIEAQLEATILKHNQIRAELKGAQLEEDLSRRAIFDDEQVASGSVLQPYNKQSTTDGQLNSGRSTDRSRQSSSRNRSIPHRGLHTMSLVGVS